MQSRMSTSPAVHSPRLLTPGIGCTWTFLLITHCQKQRPGRYMLSQHLPSECAKERVKLSIAVQGLIKQNIQLNEHIIAAAGGSASAHELTWGVTQLSQLPQQWQTPDVVVAADVVYRRELFQPLLHSLDMLGMLPQHYVRVIPIINLNHVTWSDMYLLLLLSGYMQELVIVQNVLRMWIVASNAYVLMLSRIAMVMRKGMVASLQWTCWAQYEFGAGFARHLVTESIEAGVKKQQKPATRTLANQSAWGHLQIADAGDYNACSQMRRGMA